jgi:hypothetical protein
MPLPFEGVNVHPVMATFSITRDAEWAGRIFVLAMKEEHEEGIGTFRACRTFIARFHWRRSCLRSYD